METGTQLEKVLKYKITTAFLNVLLIWHVGKFDGLIPDCGGQGNSAVSSGIVFPSVSEVHPFLTHIKQNLFF